MITKKTKPEDELDFTAGEVILIDKEKGFTSFDVVKKIRNLIRVKKVGHAGTLDPAATGLLIVNTGKMTKEIYKYQDLNKTYSGKIEIGKATPTMDSESQAIEELSIDGIDKEKIISVRDSFLGESLQIPPMFSALKYKGKPLYKLARKGTEVEREPRKIRIEKFDLTNVDLPEINFLIECTKGTYIRVIADDFGKRMNNAAYLKELRREKIGDISVTNALKINEFEELIRNRSIAGKA